MTAPRLLILCTTLLLFYKPAAGFPCVKYVFEFGDRSMIAAEGELTVSWKINTDFNRCTPDPNDILSKEFIVTIRTIDETLLLADTVKQNYYRFPSSLHQGRGFIIFQMKEMGEENGLNTMGIRIRHDPYAERSNKIESLNHFLLGGYFLNATTILHDIDNAQLLADVSFEYNKLFPEYYPYEQNFFNSYVDSVSMTLKQMPTVEGMKSFTKEINKLTKAEFLKSNGFDIEATIAKDGSLKSYRVYPPAYSDEFEHAKTLLSFTTNDSKDQLLRISIGRTKNGRKYTIGNRRALLDPNSKHFRKRFRYRGAVM